MKDIDVLLIYELESRDLESMLLLEYELRERGYSAACVQCGWTAEASWLAYRPKVIVTNSIYDEKNLSMPLGYMGGIEGNRIILINYHCEQVVTNGSLSFSSSSGKAQEVYHLAWGDYFKQVLIDAGVSERLISVTGSPRLDFYRNDMKGLWIGKEALARQYGLKSDSKWILILGNFPTAFLSDSLVQDYIERGNAYCNDDRCMTRESMSIFFEWWRDAASLLNRFDDIEVIYRPHPAEPISDGAKSLSTCINNFHIIRDYPVRQWIVNCNVCFTWLSTSSVESAIAMTPVYSLRPKAIPHHMQIPLLEHMPHISDRESFMNVLTSYLNGKEDKNNEMFLREISPYYYYVGEKTASVITADLIEDLLAEKDRAVFNSRFKYSRSLMKLFKYWGKTVLEKLGLIKMLPLYDLLPKEHPSKRDVNEKRVQLVQAIEKSRSCSDRINIL